MLKLRVLGLMMALLLTACGRADMAAAPSASAPKVRDKLLAYEHAVTINAEEGQVKPLVDKLSAACEADRENRCTVMKSSVENGRYEGAQMRLRAKPAGISKLLALAASGGTLTRQETSVEDLAQPIADNGKRLEMLRSYQQKLEALARRPGLDVDALIKLSKEQAEVQAALEQAGGESAHLQDRVNLDTLNIAIQAREGQAFWTPVKQSLAAFGGNLSSGIAGVVTGMAYLLPWLLVLAVAWWLLRKLWRRVFKR